MIKLNLGFPIGIILAIFYLQVTSRFLPSFESIGLSVQEKKRKMHYQDDGRCGHLGFPIETILAIFLSTSRPKTFYQVSSQLANWLETW